MTNKIYATLPGNNQLAVIDGASNGVTTAAVDVRPNSLAVNVVTNKIYTLSIINKTMTVVDGATLNASNITLPFTMDVLAVNPVTNKIYAGKLGPTGPVEVIDGNTLAVTSFRIGFDVTSIVVNPLTNHVYFGHSNANAISVLDGNDLTHAAMYSTGGNSLAINLATNRIYGLNSNTNVVAVVEGAGFNAGTVAIGTIPSGVAVNPVTDKTYITNAADNTMTVVSGDGTPTVAIDVGALPRALAINPFTNRIYLTNEQTGFITVVNGATNTVTTSYNVPAGAAFIAVNPNTNFVWHATETGSVNGINVATGARTSFSLNVIRALAVNILTNKIYLLHPNNANVTVIDGATNATTTVTVGAGPAAIAIDTVLNRIYVANRNSGTVPRIDGATNAVTPITTGGEPVVIAVNTATNRIYVGDAFGSISAYNGATLTFVGGASSTGTPHSIAVNTASNRVYVTKPAQSFVEVLDGVSLQATPIAAGLGPQALAVNSATGRVFVANRDSDNTTMIEEYPTQAIPLASSISPLGGHNTATAAVSIGVQGTNTFAPAAAPVRAVYYQVDSTTGPWQLATGSAPNFTASVSGLTLGTHTLYVLASDGAIASNASFASASSALSSRVAAYSFTYSPFTLALTGIKSRKVHGVSSIFEVDIPPNGNINGAVPVEPRTIGSGHRIVFQFNGTVTIPGTLSVTDALLSSIGNATAAAVGTEVIVTLTNIPDNRRAFVSLANVNGAGVDASAALGFLVGDITGTGRVNAADIAAVKARIGVAVNTINFRADVNACTQSIQQT